MPTYDYQCSKCEETVSLIRSMADSDVAPTKEETPAKSTKCKKHKWKKIMLGAPAKRLGPNWGSGKGNYNSGNY